MKKLFGFIIVLCFIGIIAGCGGGGGGTTGSTGPSSNGITLVPPANPPIAATETMKVGNLYAANAGTYGSSDYINYNYQVAKVGDVVKVGFNAYGECGGSYGTARSASGGGGGYAPCNFPGVPVSFRIWDKDVQLGPIITVLTDDHSMALAKIDLSTLGFTVPSGSIESLTVNASVDNSDYVTSDAWPNASAKIDIVSNDFVPSYAAKVDQDTAITVVSGDTFYGFGSGYVRVKNVGNIPWYNMSSPLKRVYMVTENSTGSIFFKDKSWYDATVVSDISSYTDVMPGDTTQLYFSLSGMNVSSGSYRECFKLEAVPQSITQDWNHYTLVDATEVAGSRFCVNITVIAASLARKAASDSSASLDEGLHGMAFWNSKKK